MTQKKRSPTTSNPMIYHGQSPIRKGLLPPGFASASLGGLAEVHRESATRQAARLGAPPPIWHRGARYAARAIYVALAEGLGAPLLTADMRLARGAERFGVACL
jgi:hypothetical protein